MRSPPPDDCPFWRSFGPCLLLAMFLPMGPLAGCANTAGGAGGTGGVGSAPIPLTCWSNFVDGVLAPLAWELTVTPTRIKSGEPFAANLDGVAVFNEAFLDAAQDLFPDGVLEVTLFDLRATVRVLEGATGDDEILRADSRLYEHQCAVGRAECDPENDLLGVPGRRGNADCLPLANNNPCGQTLLLPVSSGIGCEPGGVCERKMGQCVKNGFCITGDLRVELEGGLGEYTGPVGDVVFGWADSPPIEEQPNYDDMPGPLSFRLHVGDIPVALECVMGAVPPELPTFPIQTP
jgi:hypothetical protein